MLTNPGMDGAADALFFIFSHSPKHWAEMNETTGGNRRRGRVYKKPNFSTRLTVGWHEKRTHISLEKNGYFMRPANLTSN